MSVTKLKSMQPLFRWQTLFASMPIPHTLLFFINPTSIENVMALYKISGPTTVTLIENSMRLYGNNILIP